MNKSFEQLFDGFLRDDLSPGELELLMAAARDPANAAAIQAAISNKLALPLAPQMEQTTVYMKEQFRKMLERAEEIKQNQQSALIEIYPGRKYFILKRIVVAATVLLLLTVGGYFLFFNEMKKLDNTAKVEKDSEIEAPRSSRATVTLADGKVISVDSLTSLTQNSVALIKTSDGKISYRGSSRELLYNTLANPRGSQVIDMTLTDGTRVWLNAGSSLTYPVSFVGHERKVRVNGEAYFEVAHDKSKPFYVTKGALQVEVLGTHFNVDAYDDEDDIKVTLLEGIVKVSGNNSSLTLQPNQQAIVTNEKAVLNADVNVEVVMAWKNGLFSFERTGIVTLMKQLARWYDVDVAYEGTVPAMEFGGELERSLNLSQVLRSLEKSKVHFRVEGRKIIVFK